MLRSWHVDGMANSVDPDQTDLGLHYLFSPVSESESELFTGDTSKDNHSPGPVFKEISP